MLGGVGGAVSDGGAYPIIRRLSLALHFIPYDLTIRQGDLDFLDACFCNAGSPKTESLQ